APFGTVPGVRGDQVQDARGFAEARFEHELSDSLHVELRGSYDASRYRGYWIYPPDVEGGPNVRRSDAGAADWLTGEAQLHWKLLEGNTLTVGAETQFQVRVAQEAFGRDTPSAPIDTPPSRTLVSGYLLEAWRLHPRLLLSA